MKINKTTYRANVAAFFLLLTVILFFNLSGRTLENHDYLRYAEVAREMIRSGDWLVPRYNGTIYIHKPPLAIWLIALPAVLKGCVTPFIARLPSAMFALLGGIIVFFLAHQIWKDVRSAFISAGVLVTSHLYFWQGRVARIDMAFSILILMVLWFFMMGYQQAGRKKLYYVSASFVFMVLAFLVKGPAGILLPMFVVSAFLLLERDFTFLCQKECIFGYTLGSGLLIIWFVLFLSHVSWEALWSSLKGANIITRKAPFYSYAVRIWLDFAPWSFFLPSLVMYLHNKKITQNEKLLCIWIAGIFVILTIFPYRNPRYMLPIFPPLALLVGNHLSRKPLRLFIIIFCASAIVWHAKELVWINRNPQAVQGPALAVAIKPYLDNHIFAYKIEDGILEKINFYADAFPALKNVQKLDTVSKNANMFLLISAGLTLPDFKTKHDAFLPVRYFFTEGKKLLLMHIG